MACNRNTPFNKTDTIKVCVISSRGEVTTVEVKNKLSVDRIKLSALTNFIGDQIDAFQSVDKYRIVSILKKRTLSCEMVIRDENIESGDTLLLLENSPIQDQSGDIIESEPSTEPVSLSNIIEATRKLRIKNFRLPPEKSDQAIRPLLVTLIDYASTILKNNASIEPILKDLEPYTLDELAKGRKRRKKNEASIAESDAEIVKKLTEIDLPEDEPEIRNESPISPTDQSIGSDLKPSTSTDPINPLASKVYPKVPAVIDCVNNHKRLHFVPDSTVFNKLQALGFEEEEIIDAMWRSTNKQSPSVEWLTNPNRPKLSDLSRGLPYNHKFVSEILNDPRLLIRLLKPKIFLSLVLMAEDLNFHEETNEDPDLNYLVQELHRITNPCDDDGTSESDDDL